MLENKCNQSDTHGWEMKLVLFNEMVTQVLLHGVEVWRRTISLNAWNEIERRFKRCFKETIGS